MNTQLINKNWTMCEYGEDKKMPAQVPGSVYNDLLLNKKMDDPYWRDNETEILKLSDTDYIYECTFDVQDILNEEIVLLHFDGLDTLADIYLNDTHLGKTDNMHRIWEYNVKNIIKASGNKLTVHFRSPTKYIEDAYQNDKILGEGETLRGFGHLRKAHYMFGWDWGPQLPDMGIWKPVKLIGYTCTRIEDVYISQKHSEKKVDLNFEITLENELKDFNFEITVKDPNGEVITTTDKTDITIESPKIWWPNGYGEQPLYEVCVKLLKDGKVLDTWRKKIGLRTITMHVEKDEYGECFAHCVNGKDIFAMGANYIPEDNILSRVTSERTRQLLLQAKNANYNCIRVWGGGHYPFDEFYDICDELGILVWQDLMFSCSAYHLNDDFEESIKREVEDNIKRLRHHASLALWCGNNEVETAGSCGKYLVTPKEKLDYLKIFEFIIPEVVKKLDPNTFYWPSSPSSVGYFDNPGCMQRGDKHIWNVWHGNVPFTDFRKDDCRYVSEFGFQSFPSLETVKTFTLPEDRNIFSYVMEKHQRNAAANGKILGYIQQMYLYPENFDDLIYTSQLLQAEAIQYGVEHFRRIRGICMGTLVWQFNDCWPVASWSSIDYEGRWKALHYFEKRFFAPLMISCKEEGMLSQNTDPNAQIDKLEKSIQLCVSNETLCDQKLTVKWYLKNAKSETKKEHTENIVSKALSSLWLEKYEFPDADLYGDYVYYELIKNDDVISSGTVIFSMPKYFKFVNPELSVKVENDEIVVTSKAYARCVEIRNEDDTLLLSDNYFDMNAGEKKVKIISGKPEKLKVRSVYNIGR